MIPPPAPSLHASSSPHLPFPTKVYSQYWHYPALSLSSVEAFIPRKRKRIVGQNSVVLPFPPPTRRPPVRVRPKFFTLLCLPSFLPSSLPSFLPSFHPSSLSYSHCSAQARTEEGHVWWTGKWSQLSKSEEEQKDIHSTVQPSSGPKWCTTQPSSVVSILLREGRE